MSHEVWAEYYERLTTLIQAHRTTLVFVNTRRMAERVARHLSERLGEEAVTAHHGSLSKEKRLDAEMRLKAGRAQSPRRDRLPGARHRHRARRSRLPDRIAAPHRDAAAACRPLGAYGVGPAEGARLPGLPRRPDRVRGAAAKRAPGRSGSHRLAGRTAGRPGAAARRRSLVRRVRRGRALRVDASGPGRIGIWPDPISTPSSGWRPKGFATRRGRRAALVHRDEVNHRLRGRRGARLLAITSGGAIPEVADYRVVLDPEDIFIGTLNEDFAIESSRRRRVSARQRVVAGAAGRPGRRACGRRQGRAADAALLAWRGAGAQQRALARRQRSARRNRSQVGRGRRRRAGTGEVASECRTSRPACPASRDLDPA